MRWFVEISPMGTKGGQDLTLCVEAPQWQPALQKARALRGDNGALSNFSIELLDDGYRAIDPMARLRYVVKRAPDNAPLTNSSGVESPPSQPPKSSAEPTRPAAPAPAADVKKPVAAAESPRASAPEKQPDPVAAAPAKSAVVIPGPDAKKRAPAPAAPAPAAAAPAAPATAPKPAPRDPLPSFVVIGNREDSPTESSPLTYREYVYAVAQGTAEDEAKRLIFERFEHVRATLDATRSGKLVNLAVFDHIFQGRPQRRPLVTLTWKDWKGEEPELHFPQREAQGDTPTPLAPRIAAQSPARAAAAPQAPSPSVAQAAKAAPVVPAPSQDAPKPPVQDTPKASARVPEPAVQPAGAPAASTASSSAGPSAPAAGSVAKLVAEPKVASEPEAPAVAPEPETKPVASKVEPVSAPVAPVTTAEIPKPARPVSDAGAPAKVVIAPPPPAAPASEPRPVAAPATDGAALPASSPEPTLRRSTPPPKPIARAAAARATAPSNPEPPASKRLGGDELLTELFEAFGDLHFVRDALEGAQFVLNLTLEKLPSEVGLVSFFDMNKREFVVVRQKGGPRVALCARQPEKAPLALSAMRKRHAIVVSDAEGAARAMDDRWRAVGVELKSLVCAPIELSGRYLGLIELANPTDGHAFNEGDGNALSYIGQQFAEFVAARGVVVDDDHIRGEAQSSAPPPPEPKSSAGAPKSSGGAKPAAAAPKSGVTASKPGASAPKSRPDAAAPTSSKKGR